VLFSTARPYFGFPPAVSSEDAESCFETIPSVAPIDRGTALFFIRGVSVDGA